ncbi:Uncharacterised protein [Mycobacterium tuberculosis]|nr:Uncharacterised protein [Mycobacterium tuberculosis]
MLNPDESHYYWLKFDGSEGPEAWSKWYVYHSATMNSESCEIYAMLRGTLGTTTLAPSTKLASLAKAEGGAA